MITWQSPVPVLATFAFWALAVPTGVKSAPHQDDLQLLLDKGHYTELRDVLRSIENRQRRAAGRPYWLPTSIVDIQAISRPAQTGDLAALQESADLLLKIKRFGLAERAYRQALSNSTGPRARIEIQHGLAAVQFHQNGGEDLASYRKAHESFRQAAAAENTDRALRALSELGVCYTAWHVWVYGGKPAGGPSEAIAACTRALKLRPGDEVSAAICETLSSTYQDAGDRKLGILYLEQSLEHLKAARSRAKPGRSNILDSEVVRIQGRLNRIRDPKK